jgi:hypothetical protein
MSLLIAHSATYRGAGVKGRRSITILDECWALLESPNLANVVVQLFRTARKRDASVWGISQTPEDFVGSQDKPNPYGAGIMKNATTKIIGKQPGDMTALRVHMHLNETAINQLKTFSNPKKGYSSEFLITVSCRRCTLAVRPSVNTGRLCIINEHSSLQRLISKLPSLRNNRSMLLPLLDFRGFPSDQTSSRSGTCLVFSSEFSASLHSRLRPFPVLRLIGLSSRAWPQPNPPFISRTPMAPRSGRSRSMVRSITIPRGLPRAIGSPLRRSGADPPVSFACTPTVAMSSV